MSNQPAKTGVCLDPCKGGSTVYCESERSSGNMNLLTFHQGDMESLGGGICITPTRSGKVE